ncbi:MAG: type I pullulanase [Oscillospiraceae bacterium]|nr:type I pullulanase [Oscillospiraceae bacterium]
MNKNQITVKLHYLRPDGEYAGWNAWMWTLTMGGKQYEFAEEDGEQVATIVVDGYTTSAVSFIVRKGTWEEQEFNERRIDVSTVAGGTVHYYVTSGKAEGKLVMGDDAVKTNKLLAAELDYDTGKLLVRTSVPTYDPETDAFSLIMGDGTAVPVTDVQGAEGSFCLTLEQEPALVKLYQYRLRFHGYDYTIQTNTVYASKRFAKEFTYTGKDLGANWTEEATTFKVWAPTAESVRVALYHGGTAGVEDLAETIPMTRGSNGVWKAKAEGNRHGQYYTYLVNRCGQEVEAVDPYARTTGVNGNRGMIIDLASTNPKGWDKDENPNPLKAYTDAVLYELHVRDFSIDESSGVSEANRGKYLAFTERGTKTPAGTPTCLDYLKGLGITHLHLLPVYDYGSVDESRLDTPQFNWGYDPVNYNAPEGSYSTDPYRGEVRVKEFKQMVKALHDAGISVVMDVVYNHVFEAGSFCFNKIVPGYFSRSLADGSYSNGSGCGNDTASERAMVRKFIVESIVYWKEQYHIDGFRFDLVGLLDCGTINALVDAVHEKHPDVIFYGEGWTLDTAVEPGNYMATQPNAHRTPEFAYFSDDIRNLLAGENGRTRGFVSGLTGEEDKMFHCFTGDTPWCPNPTQTVNYVSCHDNYTLMDKLITSCGKLDRKDLIRMNKMAAAIYMTAQGIPFIHAGEEWLREKLDESGKRIENSYNASDFVNKIRWDVLEKKEVAQTVEYYKGLIELRKAHAALRLTTKADVAQNVDYRWITNELVLFNIKGKGSVKGEVSDGIVVILNATKSAKTVDLYAAGVARGQWEIRVNGEEAGLKRLDTVLDGKVKVEGVSVMVLTKGVAACQHNFKGGECTICGAKQRKGEKQSFLFRLINKIR